MATSTGKRDNSLQIYKFMNLTSTSSTTGAADLVAAMNEVKDLIPSGASALQFGGGSVGCRCIVIVSKVNGILGRAYSIGSYSYFDDLHMKLSGPTGGPGTWSLVT